MGSGSSLTSYRRPLRLFVFSGSVSFGLMESASQHDQEDDFQGPLLRYCLRTGFAHMAECFYRQRQEWCLLFWEEFASKGMILAPSFLVTEETELFFSASEPRRARHAEREDLMQLPQVLMDVGSLAYAVAFRLLIFVSDPFDLDYMKRRIPYEDEIVGDIVRYTLYRCRSAISSSDSACGILQEALSSFEDVVISVIADDLEQHKRAFALRSRAMPGGPAQPGIASFSLLVTAVQAGQEEDLQGPLLKHCLRTGFTHMAETFYRQQQKWCLLFWEEFVGKGMMLAPHFFATPENDVIIPSDRSRTAREDEREEMPPLSQVWMDAGNFTYTCAVRMLLRASDPFDLEYMKLHSPLQPELVGDIVRYTLYRCRSAIAAGDGASAILLETVSAFEDVVISVMSEDLDQYKRALEVRSRALTGGPVQHLPEAYRRRQPPELAELRNT